MFLFVTIIIVIIILLKYKKNTPISPVSQNLSDNKSNSNKNNIDYSQYYKPKRYVITLNELNFYNILMEVAKELDLVLFSQVSLYK